MQQCLLEYFARQAQSTAGPPSVDIHDILGDNDHVVVLGTASATARDGSSAEWRYPQIFHIRDGRATEVWGMAENDAAVDPFLDGLPGLSTGEAQPANHRALLDGTCRVMEARVHQQALPDEAGLYLAPCGVITSDTRARLSGSRSRTISIVRQPMLSMEGTWEHGVHQKSIEQLLPVPGVV